MWVSLAPIQSPLPTPPTLTSPLLPPTATPCSKMHSRSARLKRAVYEEIKACKTDAERRELARYFVSPPCMDQALVSGLLFRARA